MGKGKKRRNLDEIVLGLSAAKEQQTGPTGSSGSERSASGNVGTGTGSGGGGGDRSNNASNNSDPPKKSPVSPSPNFSTKTSTPSASQLLSRSLGSTAGGGKTSVDLSSYFGSVEQQNFLLKQQQLFHQQQQQSQQSQSHKVPLSASGASSSSLAAAAQRGKTSYEAMIADLTKGNDLASKMNSAYSSHEAKVNEVCITVMWTFIFIYYLFLFFLVMFSYTLVTLRWGRWWRICAFFSSNGRGINANYGF